MDEEKDCLCCEHEGHSHDVKNLKFKRIAVPVIMALLILCVFFLKQHFGEDEHHHHGKAYPLTAAACFIDGEENGAM